MGDARTPDLLVSGGDDEPRPSPFTRRRLTGLLAAVLAVAAVLGVVEVRERRAAAAEQRRLDRIVDVVVEARGSSSGYDPGTGQVELELVLRLVNEGPRDLVVERGRVGGYALVPALLELPAGDTTPVLLRKTITCSPTTPPPPDELGTLTLDLRTAAGPRQVSLPVETGITPDEAARSCGFLPLAESADLLVTGAEQAGGVLELDVDAVSRSPREVALVSVDPQAGLSVRVLVLDQGEAFLPLALPPRGQGGVRATDLELLLTVTDCRAAQQARPQLTFQLTDDRGRVAQQVVGYEPALLERLVSDTCSG